MLNIKLYTPAEKCTWAFLRAIEWVSWPSFVSQPIVPVLFAIYPSHMFLTVATVTIVGVMWKIMTPKIISSPRLLNGAVHFVLLKFLVCPLSAIYIVIHGHIFSAITALLWPVIMLFFILPITAYVRRSINLTWRNATEIRLLDLIKYSPEVM